MPLSPLAKPFDPATWAMGPPSPTSLSDKYNPGRHISYSEALIVPAPIHRPFASPIWNAPSRFNLDFLNSDDSPRRPVGEYGIVLDAPLPAFGQGKWDNRGKGYGGRGMWREMAPVGHEVSECCISFHEAPVRNQCGENQRELPSTSASTTSYDVPTRSIISLPSALSSNIITTPVPAPITPPHPPRNSLVLSTTTTPTKKDPMQVLTNMFDEARAKALAQEKAWTSKLVGQLHNEQPVINMQQLKEKFDVPHVLDESMYNSMSDFAYHEVGIGNLTLVDGHLIQRQLLQAFCRNASLVAADAAALDGVLGGHVPVPEWELMGVGKLGSRTLG